MASKWLMVACGGLWWLLGGLWWLLGGLWWLLGGFWRFVVATGISYRSNSTLMDTKKRVERKL